MSVIGIYNIIVYTLHNIEHNTIITLRVYVYQTTIIVKNLIFKLKEEMVLI